MQYLGSLQMTRCILRCSRAGVVHYEAPALRGLVIDVGGNHMGAAWPLRRENVDLFQHMVDSARDGVHPSYVFRPHLHGATMRKHGFKCRADGTRTHQAAAAGVNAGYIVLIGPASHEFLEVTQLQGLVESSFDFVGCTAHYGMQFCFLSWHGGILSHLRRLCCTLAVGCEAMFVLEDRVWNRL